MSLDEDPIGLSLKDAVQESFNDKGTSDFEIHCQKTCFYVHRLVMAGQSCYFDDLIRDERHREARIDDVNPANLEFFLETLYGLDPWSSVKGIDGIVDDVMTLAILAKRFSASSIERPVVLKLNETLNEYPDCSLENLKKIATIFGCIKRHSNKKTLIEGIGTHTESILKGVESKKVFISHPAFTYELFKFKVDKQR